LQFDEVIDIDAFVDKSFYFKLFIN